MSQIQSITCLSLDLFESSSCFQIQNLGGNQVSITSIVYIDGTTLISVSDSQGYSYFYDIFNGGIYLTTTTANAPILGQIFYPNFIRATLTQKKLSIVDLIQKQEILGIQNKGQNTMFLSLISADLSRTKQEQLQRGSQSSSSLIIINNKITQTIQIKPSSLDNNFYPPSDNYDYLIQVQGLSAQQQGIFGALSQNSINQYQIIEDYQVNPNQNFSQIIHGGRASLIIALNSGFYSSIYSYLINLSILNQQKPLDYVSPIVLPASVNAFQLMNSTNYLLISYGAATNFQQVQVQLQAFAQTLKQGQGQGQGQKGGGVGGGSIVTQVSSPLPLYQNSLCVYDFGKVTNLAGSSYGVDTLSVLSTPIVCKDMGTNNILSIQNIYMDNKNYVIFSLESQSIIIFENNDLINSKFSISIANMINVSQQNNGSILIMLLIPNTSVLIIGTSQGLVASYDIQDPNLISQSTQQQSQNKQISPLFSKIGIGLNGQTIGDLLFDNVSQTLIGISKQGQQGQQNNQTYFFQYNLTSQQRVLNLTQNYGQQNQTTVEQTVVFSTPPSFLTLTSVTNQYYLNPTIGQNCPSQIPTPAPNITSVKILSLNTQTKTFNLDVQKDNLNPLLIPGMLSYTSELNNQYAVILLVTQPFKFSQYCISNQKLSRLLLIENEQQYFTPSVHSHKQNRILQSTIQISLNLYIIDSKGVSVFKTNSNFYQLSSIINAPLQFVKDSVQNMFVVFQSSIMIIKPALNTPSSIQNTTITLQQISALTQVADIVQIQKVTIINPLNQMFIQLSMSDGSLITFLISYSQIWFQNKNLDLQLALLFTVNSSSNPTVKSLLTYNNIYYMQSQNILVVQYNNNIDYLQYNMNSQSLNQFLTLYNISDSNSRFISTSSDNSLYQIMSDGQVIKIYAPQCYNQSCFNTTCSIKTMLNTLPANNLQDILQNTTSNVLIRQEQIYNQVLYYSNIINYISNIEIKRYFYFGSGSVYNIKYIHYEQIASQQYLIQNNITLRLNIHTFNISLQSNTSGSYQNLPPTTIYGDSPNLFDNYFQVSFKNILWKVNFDNYQDPTKPLFQIANNICVFERFSVLTYSTLNTKNINDNFIQFLILQGSAAYFRNITIQNKNYNGANYYIQVPSTAFSLTLENITVQNCKFESTVFVSASNQLSLNATNIQFQNNQITLSQNNPQLSTFISAQSITLQGFQFQQNAIQSVMLFGKTDQSQFFVANISNSSITQNAFFIYEYSINTLILQVEFLQTILSSTYVNLTQITIQQNQVFQNNYDQSTFNQYLQVVNNNQGQGQKPPFNQINDTNTFISTAVQQQYFFFQTKYIQQVFIQNANISDNINIGFYQSSFLNLFQADTLSYKNTWLNQSQPNSACIKITEYNNLQFSLTKSTLENLYIQNDYLIYLKTSQLLSSNQQQVSQFTIDGLSIKNIKVATLIEYNQASIIFFNSLQNTQISLNNLNVANILLKTPLNVFNDMASTLSLLAPFSQASLTNSQFLNFYTQSKKEVLYMNVQNLKMDTNHFENNQFQTNAPLLGTNGGFMLIQSQNLNMTNNSFYRGTSYNGAAISLIPSTSNSNFTFKSCSFSNMISQQYGGAVYINNPPANTTFSFIQCQFTSLLASEGGSIYSYYFIDKGLNNNSSQIPNIIIYSLTINQTFASNQGSFFSFYNMNVSLSDVLLDINNPQKQINIQQLSLFQQLSQFQSIGSLFSVINSIFTLTNSQLNQILTKSNQQQSSIINLQQQSQGYMKNVNITQGSFSNGGALLVDTQSQIEIDFVNISQLSYQQSNSLRQIQQTNTSSVQLTYSQYQQQTLSTFIIRGSSQFKIYQLTMNQNQCSNLFCVGGALSLIQSTGQMDQSNFIDNISTNNGGAVSIINEISQINITSSLFQNNTSKQEGGGLFVYQNVDLIQTNQKILIYKSRFLNNNATLGGGIYLNSFSLSNNIQATNWIQISNSVIMNNSASFLGGGIQYTGFDPQISSSTRISSNTAGQKYGSNLFSRPFKLRFNQNLTQQSNKNNIKYQIKYDQNLGIERLQIKQQVSGGQLPDLIFELIDENNQIIDGSYQQIINSQIYALVQPYGNINNQNAFQISSSYQKIIFSDYFNLTDLTITGVPNSYISIQLSSPFINNPNYPENNYYYIIDIHLRECIKGEVYKKGQVIYHDQIFQIYQCSVCPKGQYSLIHPDMKEPIFECQKCVQNSDCLGGDVINVNEGFWRENNQTDQILDCINKQSNCLGGTQNFTCNVGHIGPLCESCDIQNGYSRQGDFQCSKCGDIVNNTFKVLGLVVLYIICAKLSVDGVLQRIMFIIKRKDQIQQETGTNQLFIKKTIKREEANASILLKLIINYFQVIMVITTFQINVPNVFNSSINVIANPTIQVLYSFECFFHQISVKTGINIIYIQFAASTCLPICCALVFIITGLIKYRKNLFLKRFYISTSLIYCLMYFQPSLYKDAISILSCRQIGNNRYIQYNVLYTCYTDEHIQWSLSLILPILLIITLIIPGFMMYKVYKSKDSILQRKNYMFIIGEYEMNDKRKVWYWEFIKMYMKLIIMSILIIYEYSIPNKILFTLLVVALYGFFLVKVHPYSEQLYNKIDIYSTFVLTASIYLAFITYENKDNYYWSLCSIIIIGIINTAFLIWCFKKLAYAYIPIVQKTYFQFKFLCFKLSPFQCFYTKKTARIYKFQRVVTLVLNELKKRNIINAWTGKIKVPLENIIDLIVQGREQMKNGSKLNINSSIKIRSQNYVVSNNEINLFSKNQINNEDQIQKHEKVDKQIKFPKIQESVNLEFPSENIIAFQNQNYSTSQMAAQQIPQSFFQNESAKAYINRLKSTSIIQDFGTNRNLLLELAPLSSRFEDNFGTYKNQQSPLMSTISNINDNLTNLKLLSHKEILSPKDQTNIDSMQIQKDEILEPNKNQIILETPKESENDTTDSQIPIEHLNKANENNNLHLQKLSRSLIFQEIQSDIQKKSNVINQNIIQSQINEDIKYHTENDDNLKSNNNYLRIQNYNKKVQHLKQSRNIVNEDSKIKEQNNNQVQNQKLEDSKNYLNFYQENLIVSNKSNYYCKSQKEKQQLNS
ncbi:transmembrane protein, putative (macronuclear) [Tetrahymena thermophila SB210]|uniref:Transmembrane protein, putative n=1 Tax=Tetrahymena thermophila (strain SB210) TaxID=312017 RepID=W7XBV8_TETTS|nr:transmembrane protein, putative [Tetrahymena thermophila SB210]EWS74812.1 transmembrane protein, putative [Tetrahymena thermophila SB210]|eukprot:XP_012652643.1 transmembrane protein, putative [Tetrahymena thermophila SB210]